MKISTSKPIVFLKNGDLHRIMILLLAVIITFLVVISIYPYKKYNYEELDVAKKDIIAPYDLENKYETEKTAQKNKDNTSSVVIDKKNQVIMSLDIANKFFLFVYDLRKFYEPDTMYGGDTYKRTIDQFNTWIKEKNMEFTDNQIKYLVTQLSEDEYLIFLNITFEIIINVMGNDILKSNLSDNILLAQNSYRQKGLKQETVSIGQDLISYTIFINREVDESLTNEVKDRAYYMAMQTKKLTISKGDTIVRAGEIITSEKYGLLKEADLLREKGLKGYFIYLMILLFIVALYIFILIYLKYFYKKVYKGRKEEFILLLLLSIVLILSRSAVAISPILIPLYIIPMMIAILLELKLAIVINVMLTFVVAIFVPQFDLIATLFLGGTFSAMFVQNKKQRSRLSLSGIFAAFTSAAIYIIVAMIFGKGYAQAIEESFFVLISGIFSILLTVGLLPLFEIIFNVITPSKLLELSNPNQPLLKMLLMEAPGTYHHSLMVGNLAEEATDKIGGNSLLARVGAYYHDIGKAQRPQYFIENQKNDNPHDEMNPKLSSFVVVSHVKDGEKLAREHKLPPAIIDFIKTHHGDTFISFFYQKAVGADKNSHVKEQDYKYPGPRPHTKETAVVMLADSVEAAVKSLEDRSDEKIEDFIRKIIKSKLDEGQLNDSDLSLKDLSIISKSFSHVLSGYYHTRISYPKMQEKVEKDDE